MIGLAIAAELSAQFQDIIVLEKHDSFGQETSSRNSEVIHSGIYYAEGSLKAGLCIEGAEILYKVCEKHSVPYKKTGKLIVAADQSELKNLEKFFEKGKSNGLKNLALLDKSDVKRIEPNTNAIAAIFSPDTGIIDSHSLMKHFYHMAEANGALFAFNSEASRLSRVSDGFIVGVKQEGYHFKSKIVINCAGLYSDNIAELAGIDVDGDGYKLKFCKGSYFSYANPSPVRMLVYPVPHEDLLGLGIHATLDLGGRLRFGPDTEYVDSIDYRVDAWKRGSFYESAMQIIPGLEKEAFVPDMAGIRPKLQGPGERARDFVIKEETDKGLSGLINLIGIESPGLTASPAIANMVVKMIPSLMD